jgi:hypothetical protein
MGRLWKASWCSLAMAYTPRFVERYFRNRASISLATRTGAPSSYRELGSRQTHRLGGDSRRKSRLKRAHRVAAESRLCAKVAQWRNPPVVPLRNLLVRSIPERFMDRQLETVLDIDFEPVRVASPAIGRTHLSSAERPRPVGERRAAHLIPRQTSGTRWPYHDGRWRSFAENT